MNTADSLLLDITKIGSEPLSKNIPPRDRKILLSLSRQIMSNHFLTESQGKLLVKIFKENENHLNFSKVDWEMIHNNPLWSQSFRVIEQFRKIYLSKDPGSAIVISFNYNKRLRQVISDLRKVIDGDFLAPNAKDFHIQLTEKNIYTVVKTFKPLKFHIDEKILSYYQEIEEIISCDQKIYDIFSINNEKILGPLTQEIGSVSNDNLILLNDRRLRYQYQIFQKNPEISLKNSLANREKTRVWVNSNTVTLQELIVALMDLKRLPVLTIFNGHDSDESLKNLNNLANSLKNIDLSNNVGIYFRFDNNSSKNQEFNSAVSSFEFNKPLNNLTEVAGIANNKLPKFVVSNNWKPMSVISFSNNFKNNKTSFYCDNVDLIVYYNPKEPLGDFCAIV